MLITQTLGPWRWVCRPFVLSLSLFCTPPPVVGAEYILRVTGPGEDFRSSGHGASDLEHDISG